MSNTNPKFEDRISTAGEHYFVLKARNGEIILTSEMYSSEQARETGKRSVKKNGKIPTQFTVKEAEDKKSMFVLKGTNGKTIGVSELYETDQACRAGALAVISACTKIK